MKQKILRLVFLVIFAAIGGFSAQAQVYYQYYSSIYNLHCDETGFTFTVDIDYSTPSSGDIGITYSYVSNGHNYYWYSPSQPNSLIPPNAQGIYVGDQQGAAVGYVPQGTPYTVDRLFLYWVNGTQRSSEYIRLYCLNDGSGTAILEAWQTNAY